jgi:hypothetical protein
MTSVLFVREVAHRERVLRIHLPLSVKKAVT